MKKVDKIKQTNENEPLRLYKEHIIQYYADNKTPKQLKRLIDNPFSVLYSKKTVQYNSKYDVGTPESFNIFHTTSLTTYGTTKFYGKADVYDYLRRIGYKNLNLIVDGKHSAELMDEPKESENL